MAEKRSVSGKENRKGSGIRGSVLCVILVLMIACMFLLLIHGSENASDYHEQLKTVMDGYVLLQDELQQLENKSNALTDAVKNYAVTGDPKYVDQYMEAYQTMDTGNTILADVRRYVYQNSLVIGNLMTETLELVIAGREQEIHSMKLLAMAYGLEEVPMEVEEYVLPEEEAEESPEQLKERAYDIIFGEEYLSRKESIDENLAQIRTLVSEYLEASEETCSDQFSGAVRRQHAYLILSACVHLLTILAIVVLLLVPIYLFIRDLKEGTALKKTLTYEFNQFAAIYNDNYQLNETSSLELKKQADYDALTGILNRSSFNRLAKKLKVSKEPLALLWIDVDIFKSINDNYGHEMGDQALKKVANLLKETFRSKDYPIRYGGDEFLVLMMGVSPSEKAVIGKKIDYINDVLLHPEDPDFPAFSVSVGIAFDKNGYSEELFRKADSALYYRKENGRCGYTFYQQDMES